MSSPINLSVQCWMAIDYLAEFPIPAERLPARLRGNVRVQTLDFGLRAVFFLKVGENDCLVTASVNSAFALE